MYDMEYTLPSFSSGLENPTFRIGFNQEKASSDSSLKTKNDTSGVIQNCAPFAGGIIKPCLIEVGAQRSAHRDCMEHPGSKQLLTKHPLQEQHDLHQMQGVQGVDEAG